MCACAPSVPTLFAQRWRACATMSMILRTMAGVRSCIAMRYYAPRTARHVLATIDIDARAPLGNGGSRRAADACAILAALAVGATRTSSPSPQLLPTKSVPHVIATAGVPPMDVTPACMEKALDSEKQARTYLGCGAAKMGTSFSGSARPATGGCAGAASPTISLPPACACPTPTSTQVRPLPLRGPERPVPERRGFRDLALTRHRPRLQHLPRAHSALRGAWCRRRTALAAHATPERAAKLVMEDILQSNCGTCGLAYGAFDGCNMVMYGDPACPRWLCSVCD